MRVREAHVKIIKNLKFYINLNADSHFFVYICIGNSAEVTKFFFMWQFQIQIYANVDARQNHKVLFERVIEVNDALSIPFSSLLSDLKFLFGSSCIVTFNIL